MSHQLTFADSEFSTKRRQTRKEIFLSRMEQILPWQNMTAVIEPFYPKAGNGRRPYPLETMLRIHCMQHWYNLSDGAMEDIRTKTDEQACQAGLRLCHLIGQKKIPYPEGEIGITVTAGITRVQQGETLDNGLGRADRAMYEGKQTGRNRCMFMDEKEKITLVGTNDQLTPRVRA